MYKVPMEKPKYCNKCPFGVCDYSFPLGEFKGDVSRVDGEKNKPYTHGYICSLDYNKNGKYTIVMRGKIKENIKAPKTCLLRQSYAAGTATAPEREKREQVEKPQELEEIKELTCSKCAFEGAGDCEGEGCFRMEELDQAYAAGTATAPEQYKKLASDLAIENQALKAVIDKLKAK